MRHAVSRVLGLSALVVVVLVGVVAPPASATPTPPGPDLGWMRLQPAQGTIDDAVDGLTQSKCPGGEAIVVGLTGPGIPARSDLGLMVGNTALTALPPTPTKQLWVPLSLTFRDWFGRNVPGFTPAGTYTLTTICRDALKASTSFGHFTAQVAISKAGKFQALGAAAAPFNTTKGEKEPVSVTPGSPSPGATASPGGSAAPSSTSPGSNGATGATGGQSANPQPSAQAGSTTAASSSGASGSGVRVALLGLGALLLAGAGAFAYRSRQNSTVEAVSGRHGADVH